MARFISMCYQPEVYPESIKTADYAQSDTRSTWQDEYVGAAQDNLVAAKLAVKLYELGDRLDAQQVKYQARTAFLRAWTNADEKTHSGLNSKFSTFKNIPSQGGGAFADVVKEVYATAHPHDRGLRDIVFRTMKILTLRFDHHKPEYSFLHELLEEIPDLALDLVLNTVSGVEYLCEACKNKQRFIICPCLCDKRSTSCDEKSCIIARKERTFCFHCHKLGTINAVPIVRVGNPQDI